MIYKMAIVQKTLKDYRSKQSVKTLFKESSKIVYLCTLKY